MAIKNDAIELWPSATYTVGDDTSDWMPLPSGTTGLVLILDVTAAQKDNADTLNVEVFTRVGTSTAWEIIHFTE